MKTELKEQSEFLKLLKRNGFDAYKIKASRKGVPDLEAIRLGTLYKFEQKAVGGVLSQQQKAYFKIYKLTYLVIKKDGIFWYYGDTKIHFNKLEKKIKYGGQL